MDLFLIDFSLNKDIFLKSKMQTFYSGYFAEFIVKTRFNKDLKLKKDKNNKPYFDCNDLKISISHSNNIIALLFDNNDVGVDIEYIKNRDYKKILKRFNIYDKNISLSEFYQIWTVFEAEYKSKITKNLFSFKYDNYICSISSINDIKPSLHKIIFNKDDININDIKLNRADVLKNIHTKIQ